MGIIFLQQFILKVGMDKFEQEYEDVLSKELMKMHKMFTIKPII